MRVAGSSPHARGRSLDPSEDVLVRRFIPACAGQIAVTAAHSSRSPVHPRVRGADALSPNTMLFLVGSSPRARGRLREFLKPLCHDRFIPACAGQIAWRAICRRCGRVHPRVRGADTS